MACSGAGFVIRGGARPPRVVYVLSGDRELARALTGEAQQRSEDPFEKVEIRVTKPRPRPL